MKREHGPDCTCTSRQHHPDRYGPDGGMRRLDVLRERAAARKAKYPYFPDPEGDARLSEENAPLRDAQQWATPECPDARA